MKDRFRIQYYFMFDLDFDRILRDQLYFRCQFCENSDYEAKILKGLQQALADIHGNNNLTIPAVFVDSHLDWENANEKQTFMEQAQTRKICAVKVVVKSMGHPV